MNAAVALILGMRSMMENRAHPGTAPTLMIIVPLVTVLMHLNRRHFGATHASEAVPAD